MAGGDGDVAGRFRLLRYDGKLFRKKLGDLAGAVDEMQLGGRWVPFKGDRIAPMHFGDEVDEEA